MIMCSKCNKRPAAVFITAKDGTGDLRNQGLCIKCARELGIPQIDDYFKQMGISGDDFENAYDAVFGENGLVDDEMMQNLSKELDDIVQLSDDNASDDEGDNDSFKEKADGEDLFERGGANTLPDFIKNFFGGGTGGKSGSSGSSDSSGDGKKRKEKEHNQTDKKRKCLETYCTNLTRKASSGEMDRIIGRDTEIYRVMQILSRRTKNNPCLIGEPGVGKTAIAEGIAQRIISGDVPFRLRDKEIYLLDMTALVAGTQFRGQFESRVKSLLDEVKHAGNIILFIDEVHTLVGAGDSEGSMNAANMFKPALSRGELQVIGATTFNEYRKHIEKDSALERRFQPVKVGEPNIEEAISVLSGIKEYYENHHKVKVSEEIVRLCAVLSERYINDRFLPDKAIDLLDESCACASLANSAITEFEVANKELEALRKEETEALEAVDVDYEKLAELKTKIAQVEPKVESLREAASNVAVTIDDLSKVIEMWTGIPANKIKETEYKRMASLADSLKSKVIGQDEACELVAKAIKRTRVQLSERLRPASFIFVGPTGVGKTELVKVLSKEMFDSVDPLIRLDMTEYMEKHSVSKLIGSPPGYVGYDEAGQLTERVRRRPYSVVLFDEIEKAHPDVLNILLQILDEGKLTDAQGRNVNFEHTIICMTSNAGSGSTSSGIGFSKTEGDISKERAMKGLRDFLRPEFLGRIDEVVVFSPLSKESCSKIAALMLEELRNPLKEKGMQLTINDGVCELIAEKSYGGKFGGRDIRRVIRTEIEDAVAEMIIDNSDKGISEIIISAENDELKVSCK